MLDFKSQLSSFLKTHELKLLSLSFSNKRCFIFVTPLINAVNADNSMYFCNTLKLCVAEIEVEFYILLNEANSKKVIKFTEKLLTGIKKIYAGCLDKTQISKREIECMELVAKGYSSKEISEITELSVPGVEYHIKNTVLKFEAKNRIHAATIAVNYGLISVS